MRARPAPSFTDDYSKTSFSFKNHTLHDEISSDATRLCCDNVVATSQPRRVYLFDIRTNGFRTTDWHDRAMTAPLSKKPNIGTIRRSWSDASKR